MGERVEEGDLIFRLLREDEKEKWLKFLPSVFLTTPESYFRRHLEKDVEDTSPFSRIVCAIRKGDESETILGTLRVFKRKIIWKDQIYYSSGIGEVSVASSERGKKIATKLLNFSSYLIENLTFPIDDEDEVKKKTMIISTLHTGEQAPLYRSLGYEKITRKLIVANISDLSEIQSPSFQHICEFDFDLHLKEVKNLYQEFNSLFYGAIYRSELYWKNWVKEETIDPFLLLFDNNQLISYFNVKREKCNNKDISYDNNEIKLVLKDFAISSNYFDKISHAFITLLKHWVNIQSNEKKNIKITLPLPVYNLLKEKSGEIVVNNETVDNGFLVKIYHNHFNADLTNSFTQQTIENNQLDDDPSFSQIFSLPNEENFLFWATDGF